MRLRFGDCVFDADTREVSRGDQSVTVSPKAFALLELLIEVRPGAVSKADIHERIWPGIHVSEANLANLVVELRAALGDNARRPRIIRTLPRFGYAFRAAARPERSAREGPVGRSDRAYRLVWGRREISLEPGANLIGRDSRGGRLDRRRIRLAAACADHDRAEGRDDRGPGEQERDVCRRKEDPQLRFAGRSGRHQDRPLHSEPASRATDGLDAFDPEPGTEMTLAAGARLGSYEIRGLLGAGGMGEVYRARDVKLSREVAIKVLPPELAGDARRLERFEKEARTASALSHPNIVTVYDIGAIDGTSYIAMELVEGRTLRDLLATGPVPLKKLLSIGAQAADGLAKAHAAGIVHRDLKPENLMVTRDGFVKILDFGLVKLMQTGLHPSGTEPATVTRVTEAGTVLGTVGYMSPEQASGEPVDFRSDQFSLGSILYEMASGKRAFERPTPAQTLSAIIDSEPEPLAESAPKVPTNLLWVVERCLAKDPEDRYGSTKDLARDLATLRDRSSGAPSASGVSPPERRRLRISRAVLGATALAVAGLAAFAFLAGTRVQARRDREAPPPKRTTLTFRQGFVTGARFASDGQTIVYSACWDGKPCELFTTRVGSTEYRPLGIPDGVLLAASSTGELAVLLGCTSAQCLGVLARVPLAGGAPREIVDGVVSADWSPDGKDLAASFSGHVEYPLGKVVHEAAPRGFISFVRVSPDGRHVAFLDFPRRESDRGILTVVDRTGKKVLAIEGARLGPILWSPTGEEVFFTRFEGREIRGASLSGRTRAVSWVPGLDDVSSQGLFLDTGKLSENYRGVIRGLVPGEREERNLSWLGRSVVADLSSDGKQLLLFEETRSPDAAEEEVFTTFLRKTDGSDAVRLGQGRALALSPDRAWALVVRSNPESHLVLLPTGAGEPRRLEGGGLMYRRARFFPDGERILFNADEQLGEVRSYVQDLEGGPPKVLDRDALIMIVSPDGRSFAGRGERGLGIFPVGGQGPGRWIEGPLEWETLVQWSSDGKAVYGFGEEDGTLLLYRIDLQTGRQERWKKVSPPDRTGFMRYGTRPVGGGVSVTPDGQFYAYSYYTDSSRLTLVDVGPDWWK